jgi:hypothetical protein
MNGKYLVSVCGSHAPLKMHDTLESAKTEAERLSRLKDNRDSAIYVVQIQASLIPASSHKWEGE